MEQEFLNWYNSLDELAKAGPSNIDVIYKAWLEGKYNRIERSISYQLCPKCNGQGIVSKPPYVAGDVYEWSSTQSSFTCDVCNGSKIIPKATID